MTTIGDSFAVVALLMGIGVTAWALTMIFGLFFPKKAVVARELLEQSPWKSFWVGLLVAVTLGTVNLILIGAPSPIAKVAGVIGLSSLLCAAIVGFAGISQLAAGRIQAMEPKLSAYGAYGRASALIVVSTFFPILGWFFIAPVLLVLSLGLGSNALFARRNEIAPEPIHLA